MADLTARTTVSPSSSGSTTTAGARNAGRGAAELPEDFLPKPWPKFIGRWPRLTGRHEPEFWSGFAGDETDGDVAANLGFENRGWWSHWSGNIASA
jgi:hypothetical protein